MVKTVCVCPVHRLESNVRPLSFRGWIQDMSGDTSSCLGEWISFAPWVGKVPGASVPWCPVSLYDSSSFLLSRPKSSVTQQTWWTCGLSLSLWLQKEGSQPHGVYRFTGKHALSHTKFFCYT